MTQVTDPQITETPSAADLVTAICQVLRDSPEPLTVSKIRSLLPAPFRHASPEELLETLRRQLAASVVQSYPKYRSQQERFWDRPMEVHVTSLVRAALADGPLSWSELRRKLPAYAQEKAEGILPDHIARGELHRHPRLGRIGERIGIKPPDVRSYLGAELASVFERLRALGFSSSQLREGALDLLHNEEWAPAVEAGGGRPPSGNESPEFSPIENAGSLRPPETPDSYR